MQTYVGTKQTYVGTKMIEAEPSARPVGDGEDFIPGYHVRYPDGYDSWSPKATFEDAYRASPDLDFSAALYLLKRGYRMARQGWNGQGMFVFLVQGSTFQVSRPPLNEYYPEGWTVTYRPHLDMRAVDGSIGVWVPSQTDILADDWEIVE